MERSRERGTFRVVKLDNIAKVKRKVRLIHFDYHLGRPRDKQEMTGLGMTTTNSKTNAHPKTFPWNANIDH
jgi:hypothetical protein